MIVRHISYLISTIVDIFRQCEATLKQGSKRLSQPHPQRGWDCKKAKRRKFRIKSAETMEKIGMQAVCNSPPPFKYEIAIKRKETKWKKTESAH